MAYAIRDINWCEAVRSSILAIAWLLVFISCCFWCAMASRPKVCPWPRPRPQPQRGYFLLVVLWNRAILPVYRFLEMGILPYPSRKRILYFQRGPRLKKSDGGPRTVALRHWTFWFFYSCVSFSSYVHSTSSSAFQIPKSDGHYSATISILRK